MELKFNLAADGKYYECVGMEPEDYAGPVTVPDEWAGLPVRLAAGAFRKCGLTAVHLPAGITRIPDQCFYECRNLAEVTFGEGSLLRTIDGLAFCGCTGNLRIRFPESLRDISCAAFWRARIELQIPETCSVRGGAFDGAKGKVERYEYGLGPIERDEHGNLFRLNKEGTGYIIILLGDDPDEDCPEFYSVPESFNGLPVTMLGERFCSCRDEVRGVAIPKTVRGSFSRPFYGCDYMEQIVFAGTMEEWKRTGIWFWETVVCDDGELWHGGHESF